MDGKEILLTPLQMKNQERRFFAMEVVLKWLRHFDYDESQHDTIMKILPAGMLPPPGNLEEKAKILAASLDCFVSFIAYR